MAIRKIAVLGNPILRQVARPLFLEELRSEPVQTLIDDLIETMRDAEGAGLAAPQIYQPLRICAIEVGNNPRYPYKPKIPLTILVNPQITPLTEETFDNYEGCLSVPNLRGRVPRCPWVRVEAWDRHGAPLVFEARGISAGTYQHEVDHLDATVFVDRVRDTRSLCTWQEWDRHQREGFIEQVKQIVARWGA